MVLRCLASPLTTLGWFRSLAIGLQPLTWRLNLKVCGSESQQQPSSSVNAGYCGLVGNWRVTIGQGVRSVFVSEEDASGP